METLTLTEKQEKDDQSQSFQFPIEIITEILIRLPIKSLIQLKSLSKHHLNLITSPSFTKLHFNHTTTNNRTAVFLAAYNASTRHRYLLSGSRNGGAVEHITTLIDAPSTHRESTESEHLKGLVLFTSGNGFVENNYAFIINPSTHKILKLNCPGSEPSYTYGTVHICYFFGYDDVENEHKVLNIRMLDIVSLRPFKPSRVEFMLFTLSSGMWRTIDVELPIDISGEDWYYGTKDSICVNSVIHLMLQSQNEILAFDLRTERFEIIKIPREALPVESGTWYTRKGMRTLKLNQPFLMKVNGFLGVLCHDRVVESNEMDLWILKDYESRGWVKETIVFAESWVKMDGPFPLDCVNVDEIAFSPKSLPRNLISVLIYDMKTRSFKKVKYFLSQQFLRSKTVEFNQVKSYVESILPLERSENITS